jgi:hypothetical protein
MNRLEVLKVKAEITNCERIAKSAEPSLAVALRERAETLRKQVEAAENNLAS